MSAHEHSAWWMLLGAVILSAMLLWFAAEDLRSFISRRKALAASNSVDIMVKGMTCGGCASRLERVLLATDGVTSASVSIEDHRAIVVGLSVESVSEVIDKAGFKAVR
jgi:copper chaperone CopZ